MVVSSPLVHDAGPWIDEVLRRAERFCELAYSRHVYDVALRQAATIDALTGLVNRAEFARLADIEPPGSYTLLYIDLDRFKQINDTLGHGVGDAVLVETARRLRASVRSTDIVARFGGDEFVVLLPRCGPDLGVSIGEAVERRLRDPMSIGSQQIPVSATLGVAHAEAGETVSRVIDRADASMYRRRQALATSFTPLARS